MEKLDILRLVIITAIGGLLGGILFPLMGSANYYQVDPGMDPTITTEIIKSKGFGDDILRVQDLKSRSIIDVRIPRGGKDFGQTRNPRRESKRVREYLLKY